MPQLIVHFQRDNRRHVVDLPARSPQRVTVGRDETNNVVLPESWASRHHLSIFASGTQLGVEVIGRNGIRLENGSVIRPDDHGPAQCFFSPGERFYLGPDYAFEVADAAEEPTLATPTPVDGHFSFQQGAASADGKKESEETEMASEELHRIRDEVLARLKLATPAPPADEPPAPRPGRAATPEPPAPPAAAAPASPPAPAPSAAPRLRPALPAAVSSAGDRAPVATPDPAAGGGAGAPPPDWRPRPSRNVAAEASRGVAELFARTLEWLRAEGIDPLDLASVDHAGDIARVVSATIDQTLADTSRSPHHDLWARLELASLRRRQALGRVYSPDAPKRSPGRLLGSQAEEDAIAEALAVASDPEALRRQLTARQWSFLWVRHLVRTVLDVLYGVGGLEEWLADPAVVEVHLRGGARPALAWRADGTREEFLLAPGEDACALVVRRLLRLAGVENGASSVVLPAGTAVLPAGVRLVAMEGAGEPASRRFVLHVRHAPPAGARRADLAGGGAGALAGAALRAGWGVAVAGRSGDGRTTVLRELLGLLGGALPRRAFLERGAPQLAAGADDALLFPLPAWLAADHAGEVAASDRLARARAARVDLVIADDVVSARLWARLAEGDAAGGPRLLVALDRLPATTWPEAASWLRLDLAPRAPGEAPRLERVALLERGAWVVVLRRDPAAGALLPAGEVPDALADLVASGALDPAVLAPR